MKILFSLLVICSVFILAYANYVDGQTKKRQKLTKVIDDAEHSLKIAQNNPNYLQHSHLSAYQQTD